MVNSPFRAFHLSHVSLPYLLHQVKLPARPHCLEIGCGVGNAAAALYRRLDPECFMALDYDPEQVRTAMHRFSHLSGLIFTVGSADNLPAKDGCCDVVFNMGILHHVEEWRQAVGEVYRVLKPGGFFLFEDIFKPLVDSFFFRIQYDHPEKAKFHDYEFTGALKEVGFTLTNRFKIARHYIIGVARK